MCNYYFLDYLDNKKTDSQAGNLISGWKPNNQLLLNGISCLWNSVNKEKGKTECLEMFLIWQPLQYYMELDNPAESVQ